MMSRIIGKKWQKGWKGRIGHRSRTLSKKEQIGYALPLKKADAAGGENHGREWRKEETDLYSKASTMKAS